MSEEKMSIVLFSGTVDKLMAASIIAVGASAMGKKVTVFLTFYGLMAFRKGDWQTNTRFSKDFEEMAEPAMAAMKEKNVPNWMNMLNDAAEVGDLTIKACGMTMDLFGIEMEHLEPIVEEVTGVGTFVQDAEGGQTMFI
ncbi:MAG: DsrE/DsrF/DrsH-like family protein [Verrucomicrobiota bacterium]